MKKIIVIGCPGSGKSTFSRELSKKTGLELFHLDMMRWKPDRTMVEGPVFLEKLEKVLSLDEWIIDGNYASTMELRMSVCDTVIFMDYPTEVCLDGIEKRRGKTRPDMPWVETTRDEEFIDLVRNYNVSNRPRVLALIEKYNDREIIIFTSREESEEFLQKL